MGLGIECGWICVVLCWGEEEEEEEESDEGEGRVGL